MPNKSSQKMQTENHSFSAMPLKGSVCKHTHRLSFKNKIYSHILKSGNEKIRSRIFSFNGKSSIADRTTTTADTASLIADTTSLIADRKSTTADFLSITVFFKKTVFRIKVLVQLVNYKSIYINNL